MSKGPLPRFLLTIAVALLALSASTCSSGPMDCFKGDPNQAGPRVCVGLSGDTITLSPDPIKAWDVLPNNKTKPVTIIWTANGGGNLQIDFDDANQGCVQEAIHCDGHGHCEALTMDITEHQKQCKYKVTLDGRVLDPDVII